jgi:ABC-type branched-subunit amino acid transport system ATPase component
MLLVDHDMSLVLPVSDYVYVLDFGRVLAKGAPVSIQSDPKVIAAYLGEESAKELERNGAVVALARKKDEPPLLEVKRLAAGYGHLEVIRDVNLTVRPGEVVACIGANGAGKTTTLRAISGMIHPRSGQVMFNGRDITGKTAEHISREGLVHVPEGRGLFPNLTVEDTLRLVSNSLGHAPDLATAYRLFPKLKERRNQAVGTLSGGEQQMVALARAVLARPRLVMVDEMSQGLAPTVVRQLFEIIRMMRDEGIAVLIVEQFVESALEVADRAYVFEHGTIGHSGSAAELRADRKLISGSYLGSGVVAASNGNGHQVDPALMEVVSLKMPAKLKRTLEERAEKEGRPTGAIVMELLEGGKRV